MRKKPHLVVDNQIPYLEGIIPRFAHMTRLPYHKINKESLQKADALRKDAYRLFSPAVARKQRSFIGSPTIGTDHIDLDYCTAANIRVAHAPGCNASAVMQYVFTPWPLWLLNTT